MSIEGCASASPIIFENSVPSAAHRRISAFRKWKAGWCFGRGDVFPEEVLNNAEGIAAWLEFKGWQPEAYPGEEGEITVSGRMGNVILNAKLRPLGDCFLALEEIGKRDYEDREETPISFPSLVRQIAEITSECTTSGSFSLIHGARATGSLKTPPSTPRHRAEEGAFHSPMQRLLMAREWWRQSGI